MALLWHQPGLTTPTLIIESGTENATAAEAGTSIKAPQFPSNSELASYQWGSMASGVWFFLQSSSSFFPLVEHRTKRGCELGERKATSYCHPIQPKPQNLNYPQQQLPPPISPQCASEGGFRRELVNMVMGIEAGAYVRLFKWVIPSQAKHHSKAMLFN